MIVLGEEKRLAPISKKTFCLWYIYGPGPIIDRWYTGIPIVQLIDRKQQNASFTNKAECDKVMDLYKLYIEDFNVPKEFCRKKGYDFYLKFWEDVADLLYLERIWIHRSSDLKGVH